LVFISINPNVELLIPMSLSEYIKNMNELNQQGRCLHFDSGEQCNQIISAHSIQKSGQLKNIIENNHVMHIDPRVGSMIKNKGKLSASLISWNKVSTFNGFCQKHDNEIFAPIDDYNLIPTDKQIMLYAYRSLCKGLYAKENAYQLLQNYITDPSLSLYYSMLEQFYEGTKLGLNNLRTHKQCFDNSLSNKKYDDIVYVCFMSNDTWNTQFSGVLYPEFDFLGNQIQDIGNPKKKCDLITFFTAPTGEGWAFIFAWHKSSNKTCYQLLASLAEAIHRGHKIEDCIFRFSIASCETHAFRPSWWESLPKQTKDEILSLAKTMTEPNTPIPNTCISKGLEDVASWSFPEVISTM